MPLGEVATYINGRAFKPKDWVETGKPIIRIKNLTNPDAPFDYFDGEVAPGHLVDSGDLLVSWSASLDAFIWNRGPAVVNQHIFKVVENRERITRQYLYFALREAMSEIGKLVHGATMQHVTKPVFEAFKIPLPPRAEQERIAAELTAALAEVDKARRAAQDRLAAAQAIPAAFVQEVFDTIHAGEFPILPLGEIIHGKGEYGTSRRSNRNDAGLPVLGMPHIHQGRIRWERVSHVALTESEAKRYRLAEGDLLFNRTNSAELVGKAAVFDGAREAVFASYLIRFRVREDCADPRYVCAFINSRYGRGYVTRHMARAIGQVNISASTMRNMPIPIPRVEEQRRIVADLLRRLHAAEALIARCREELAAIDALPAALLRSAFGDAS